MMNDGQWNGQYQLFMAVNFQLFPQSPSLMTIVRSESVATYDAAAHFMTKFFAPMWCIL